MRIGTRRLGWPMWIALIAMGASAVCRADEAADSSGPALFREFCAMVSMGAGADRRRWTCRSNRPTFV